MLSFHCLAFGSCSDATYAEFGKSPDQSEIPIANQQQCFMPSRFLKVVSHQYWMFSILVAAVVGLALYVATKVVVLSVLVSLAVIATAVGMRRYLHRSPSSVSLPLLLDPKDILSGSEHRLRLLESAVIHAHDAIVILAAKPASGPGRSVLYVNDAFCRMTGYDREELIGRSLHLLRGPESDQATLDQIRSALNESRPLRVELRNYRKDGTAYWVDLSLVPVLDSDHHATHWVMIQRDITEQRTAQDQLRRSEELFRGIFESAAAGVSLTEPGGRFVSCNPAFAAMLGRSVEDVLKLTPFDITHPDDWKLQQPLMAAVQAGQMDRYQIRKRYLRPDGEPVWVELSFAAIRSSQGKYEFGLGVALNITEKHELEEQLRQSQKMEAIGQMAGGVAHDFNNLLTGILGNLSLIKLSSSDPNAALLAAAEQAAVRAADLTSKLLGYARRNQLHFSLIRPAEAFDELLGLLRHALDPRIHLTVDVSANCGPILADPTLLNQALLNLCLNARDAMPKGGTLSLVAEPVELRPGDADRLHGEARVGSYVRLSVIDTGEGMTDEIKARIFEPFFTTKEVGKGTGLGLPMVQGIVKQHHGWITCQSQPQRGTRFDLYLPAAQEPSSSPEQPTQSRPARVKAKNCVGEPSVECSDQRPTILLVDDEELIRNLGQTVLLNAGYDVLTATDGAEAVDVFSREHKRIQLVILDVTMPRMSGRDAFRHLIEIDPTARILFSTGYSAEEIAELDEAVGLLHKPYRPHELLSTVKSLLDPAPVEVGACTPSHAS